MTVFCSFWFSKVVLFVETTLTFISWQASQTFSLASQKMDFIETIRGKFEHRLHNHFKEWHSQLPYFFFFLNETSSRAHLVPVFSFGENEVYDQVENPRGTWLRWIQEHLQRIMGISLPLFHARGIFQYSFGLLPYRRPITTVGM